jgi:hypothetical protein
MRLVAFIGLANAHIHALPYEVPKAIVPTYHKLLISVSICPTLYHLDKLMRQLLFTRLSSPINVVTAI